MAMKYPIRFHRDEDYELRLQWKTKVGNNPPVLVDITPYTFTLVISNGNVIDTIPCTKEDGYIVFRYDIFDIEDLPSGSLTYKLKATGPNNKVLLSSWIRVED